MRKGMVVALLALVVGLVAGAGTASADGSFGLTLQWSPAVISSGSDVTFTGQLTEGGVGVADAYVEVDEFDTPDCSIDTFWDTSAGYGYGYTDGEGNYSFGPASGWPLVFTGGSGQYYLQATYWEGETPIYSSACLPLNPPAPSGVQHEFLCYSKWQVQPGSWPRDDALALLSEGYWLPTAVDGNVDGGTNVGTYNLQCNVAAKGDGWVGATGLFYEGDWAAYAAAEGGLYPH